MSDRREMLASNILNARCATSALRNHMESRGSEARNYTRASKWHHTVDDERQGRRLRGNSNSVSDFNLWSTSTAKGGSGNTLILAKMLSSWCLAVARPPRYRHIIKRTCMLSTSARENLVNTLYEASQTGKLITSDRESYTSILDGIDAAYDTQARVTEKLVAAGHVIVGWEIGELSVRAATTHNKRTFPETGAP